MARDRQRSTTHQRGGEIVRTRTVVSQAHSSQWLGSFGNRGNGAYRKKLALALGSFVARKALWCELSDCPDVPVGKTGCRCRVVVATHPTASKKSSIGHTHKGMIYEFFFTQLPQEGFTASDAVALYLHRGAFEPLLADEDDEQDPNPWCSHTLAGQDACESGPDLASE